jgi:hypothetical protein
MTKPINHKHAVVMFLLDPLYLGNSGGGLNSRKVRI